MSSNRPLIWLFVAATVIVDLVLWTASGDHLTVDASLAGLALAHVSVLAVWASCGPGHRLLRGAVLVVATALLAMATADAAMLPADQWLPILAVTATISWGASMLFGGLARRIQRKETGAKAEPFRVPLVELFGWTIVVAIISLAMRHMDPKVLLEVFEAREAVLLVTVILALVPLAGTWVMRIGIRRPLFPLIVTASAVTIVLLMTSRNFFFLVVVSAEAAYIAVAAVLFRLVLRAEKAPTAGPKVRPTADRGESG